MIRNCIPTVLGAVLHRWENQCAYCATPLDRVTGSIDHFIPLKLGGANRLNNLVASCKPCNRAKNCTPPEQWLGDRYEALAARLAHLSARECFIQAAMKSGHEGLCAAAIRALENHLEFSPDAFLATLKQQEMA